MMAIDDAELLEARAAFLESIVPSMLAVFVLLVGCLAAFIRFGSRHSIRSRSPWPMSVRTPVDDRRPLPA